MKKLAVVASGWHFPLHFFEKIAKQKMPMGWQADFFCVSHRDPLYSILEKKKALACLGYARRDLYDRILYSKIATVEDIKQLGWNYILEPNLVGDWGNTNQWLEKNDYRAYDKFLFTHDDNFILTDTMFENILPQEDWLILANSNGNSQRRLRQWLHLAKPFNIRGSFEFFTKEMLNIMDGKFDLSGTTLTREGEIMTSGTFTELSGWNKTVGPLTTLLKKKNLFRRVKALSIYYRMSIYCLEGERGYIHNSEKSNINEEELGLDFIEEYYRLNLNKD